MAMGTGDVSRTLSEANIASVVDDLLATHDVDDEHVVLLIPDGTRTAPVPSMLRLLHERLVGRARRVDVLVALGTHPQMGDAELDSLVAPERGRHVDLPGMTVVNHAWDAADTFATLGSFSADDVAQITGDRLQTAVDVRVNRLVVEADVVLVCGPVFPHEVVGFSGGNKYFFPGVSGPELIDLSHWLGALITSHEIIGTRGITPVRGMIDRAASMIPTPRLCLAMVVQPGSTELHGLYAGTPEEAWQAAAELSAQVHVRYVERPYQTVLSVMPPRYTDIWTAAKGMYKVEPVVADGGEVIIYAPHIQVFSHTHGAALAEIGYHIRDYFVSRWDEFEKHPWGVLAHSTHLRGAGKQVDGVERPRVRVTLATGIPRDLCEAHGLGYRDPADVDVEAMRASSDPDVLVVPDAGEILYRLAKDVRRGAHPVSGHPPAAR